MTNVMNKTSFDSYLYNLVIEDDPDPKYSLVDPVDPRGPISYLHSMTLSIELYRLGIDLGYWSESASLYLADICLGAAEVFNPSLTLQDFFAGLASVYHQNGGGKIDETARCVKPRVMNCVDTPVEFKELADVIASNYDNCEQPYAIPFVIYEDNYKRESNRKFSQNELAEFAELGKSFFGEGATTLILPVITSKEMMGQLLSESLH